MSYVAQRWENKFQFQKFQCICITHVTIGCSVLYFMHVYLLGWTQNVFRTGAMAWLYTAITVYITITWLYTAQWWAQVSHSTNITSSMKSSMMLPPGSQSFPRTIFTPLFWCLLSVARWGFSHPFLLHIFSGRGPSVKQSEETRMRLIIVHWNYFF